MKLLSMTMVYVIVIIAIIVGGIMAANASDRREHKNVINVPPTHKYYNPDNSWLIAREMRKDREQRNAVREAEELRRQNQKEVLIYRSDGSAEYCRKESNGVVYCR